MPALPRQETPECALAKVRLLRSCLLKLGAVSFPTQTPPLLAVRDLTIRFRRAAVPAVDALSFSIAPGESLGLVGESGSGKSVTALAVLGLLAKGSAEISGAIEFISGELRAGNATAKHTVDLLQLPAEPLRRLRGREIAMIFQEPMTALNPVMPVGAQIAEALAAHQPDMPRRAVREAAHKALDDVALPPRRAGEYPHQFSGGQRQRILIAMAIINRPKLLIADEPTTALDVTVQAQILELLRKLRAEYGLAMLFISHDLAVVSEVVERVAVMRGGVLLESAPVRALFRDPVHPYTRALLKAVPTMQTPLDVPLATLNAAAALSAAAGRREGVLREHAPEHWVRSA